MVALYVGGYLENNFAGASYSERAVLFGPTRFFEIISPSHAIARTFHHVTALNSTLRKFLIFAFSPCIYTENPPLAENGHFPAFFLKKTSVFDKKTAVFRLFSTNYKNNKRSKHDETPQYNLKERTRYTLP